MRLLLVIISLLPLRAFSQQDSVQWLSWDQAMVARQLESRKLLIYVYQEGDSLCSKMDNETWKDTVIHWYTSNAYHPIKFKLDSKDTINFRGRELTYRDFPDREGGYHDLVGSLIKYSFKMPALVIMDEGMKRLTVVHGFFNPLTLDRMLGYYADDAHLNANPLSFGTGLKYECKNPNHPHNRLRLQEQKALQDAEEKKDE